MSLVSERKAFQLHLDQKQSHANEIAARLEAQHDTSARNIGLTPISLHPMHFIRTLHSAEVINMSQGTVSKHWAAPLVGHKDLSGEYLHGEGRGLGSRNSTCFQLT